MITIIDKLSPGRYPAIGDLARHFLEGRPDLFPDLWPHAAGGPEQLIEAARKRQASLEQGEPAAPRQELARILTEQNQRLGSGPATTEAITRLAAPGAMAVVTGQQAGFLGGPLYTFYKALGAIRAAERLRQAGIEAVAVFWIAADDHDFAEVRPFTWLSPENGALETVELPGVPAQDGCPVSAREPGDLAEVAAAILKSSFTDAREPLAPYLETYGEGVSLSESFGRIMARLFGRYGLIMVDPTPREMKQLAAPLLETFLGRLEPLGQALAGREQELASRGYQLQVPPRPGRTGLFLLDDQGRRRAVLHREPGGTGDAFILGGGEESLTLDGLKKLAAEEPWRWSGSALTRCLFQDYLFPTAAYVGGPGEVAYLAQSSALYPVLGMSAPAVIHRPSFTIIEPAAERFLQRYDLDPAAAVLRPEEMRPRLLKEAADPGLLESLEQARHRLGQLLDDLEARLRPLDPGLSGPVGKVRGGGFTGLDRVEKKVRAAIYRKERTTFDGLERTLNLLHPRGKPQERILAGLPFVCRRGTELLDSLLEATEPCSAAHLIVACR